MTAAPEDPSPLNSFIARQAIFDTKTRVVGYELLFRSGFVNACDAADIKQASSKVISDSLFLPGFDKLTAGRTAFVNVTRDLLVGGHVTLLPPATTVLEILETVRPDEETLEACRRLKQEGYRIALDDFRHDTASRLFLPVADIVKVDVLETRPDEVAAMARRFAGKEIVLVAEKVETHDEFRRTRDLGYHLFQGYFFARPDTVTCRDIPATTANYFKILQELHRPELDIKAVGRLIEGEVALSYKLLRFLNSAWFGWRNEVRSVHHALLLMGEKQIRNWASIVAIGGLACNKPGALVNEAILRSRLCELLAVPAGIPERASDLFLVGMFSLLDAILDRPLDSILAELPVSMDVKLALLGHPGKLRDVYDVALAYCTGDWLALDPPAQRLALDQTKLHGYFVEALGVAGEGFDLQGDAKAA